MPPDHPCEKNAGKRKQQTLCAAESKKTRIFAPPCPAKAPARRTTCGNSSVGRAQPCQGWGREFESRFPLTALEWWNGRHEGLKIPWPVMAVRVRVPLRAHGNARRPKGLPGVFCLSSLGLARRPTTGMRAPKPRINRQARRRPDRAPGCRHSRPAPACGLSPRSPAVRVPHATCRRCPPSCDCHRRAAGGRA